MPRDDRTGPTAGRSAGAVLPRSPDGVPTSCAATRPRSGLPGAAQPFATSEPAGRWLGHKLLLRPARSRQWRLLRLNPVRWTALFCAWRCLRQGRGRFYADGATPRLVPQPDWNGPAAWPDGHPDQSRSLRQRVGWAVRDPNMRIG